MHKSVVVTLHTIRVAPNGVVIKLMKYRTTKKEDYVIFWTNLIPPKGVLNFLLRERVSP